MKVTLLKIVQDILSAMDSDEVNSIGDTVESRQVATVVETVYNNIVARTEFPEQHELVELKASGDPAKPNLMYVPNSLDNVEWVKYNSLTTDKGFSDLKFLPTTEFLERMYSLGRTYRDDPEVQSYSYMKDDNSIEIYYKNNVDPSYFTFIHGVGVLFDAVDTTVADTLMKTRALAYGRRSFSFDLSDDFVPPLDSLHFNILYQEAKALAFAELKQTSHAIAERNAKDSRIHAQRRKDSGLETTFYHNLPRYGRR